MRLGRLELTLRARESAKQNVEPSAEPSVGPDRPTGKLARARHFARRRGLAVLAVTALIGLPGTVAASRMMADDGEQAMSEEDWGASVLDPEDEAFVQANWERAMDIEPIYDEGLDLEDEDMEPLVGALATNGIPEVADDAYRNAEDVVADSDPDGGVPWSLVAAIGRVESNHGRFGGAQLLENGYGTRPIRGVPLNGGPGVALIRDTDNGELDDDTTYDRAVGPMQFIPSSWPPVAADGNGDGLEDPDNIYDAAIGTAVYLAATDGDLYNDESARREAIFRYNHSEEYVRTVLSLAEMYEEGGFEELPFEEPGADAFDDFDAEGAAAGELGPELPEPPAAPVPSPSTPTTRPQGPPTTRPAPSPTTTTTSPRGSTTTTTTPPATTTTTTPPGSTTTTTPPGSTTTTTPPGSTTTTIPVPEPPDEVPELPEPPTEPISVGWPQGMNELPPAQLPPAPTPPTTQPPATSVQDPAVAECPSPADGVDPAAEDGGAVPADPGSTETTDPACQPPEGAPASTDAGGAGTDGASTGGEAAGSTAASAGETSAP
jgi:hypothetical protein